jgi:hypothetical protein
MYLPTSQQDVTKGTELMRRLYTLKDVQRRRMVTGRLPFMSFVSVYLFHHSIFSFFLSCFYRPSIFFLPTFFLPSQFSPLSPTFKVNSLCLLFRLSSFTYALFLLFLLPDIRQYFSDIPQTASAARYTACFSHRIITLCSM